MKRRVVALATMKGGSGKSTAALCLAAHWWNVGRSVAVIDADPQRSILRWQSSGKILSALECIGADESNIHKTITDCLDRGIERIVVDTPGFRAPVTEIAIAMAGLCLIPVRPSPVDFEVAADKVEMIAKMQAAGSEGPISYRFLLTQIIQGSVISRHMRNEMIAAGYPLLNAKMNHRVAYAEAALGGSTPTLEQPHGKVATEIKELAEEVDEFLE
jgi:chromosome partitioning protein